jgi:homoserine dehydrogenase
MGIYSRDINQSRICSTDGIQLTQDPAEIVNNDSIDIVLELMGGTGLEKELVETAIKNGKHDITADKALIAISVRIKLPVPLIMPATISI